MMTHEELVLRAARWLRNGVPIPRQYGTGRVYVQRARCNVVLTERIGWGENPDAIGWAYHGTFSFLVECKASRSDFLRDKGKLARRTSAMHRMGRYRYYFTLPGIIADADLPEGWGLCHVRGSRTVVIRHATLQEEYAQGRELGLLVSELTKYQLAANGRELFPSRAASEVMANLGIDNQQVQDGTAERQLA